MPLSNRPVADRGPISEADRVWYRIVRQVVSMHRALGSGSGSGRAQAQQKYVQTCLQREANGEAAIMPTPGELNQLLAGINDHASMLIRASLESFKECRAFEEYTTTMLSAGGFISDGGDEEREGESIGIQFSPNQVDEFVETSARVEIGALESDEMECSICKFEYGTYKGEEIRSTEPALDQELPSEDAPEQPAKLPCGHVFGEWCIKTWLLEQPATCPTCRFQFKPVVQLWIK